MYNMSNGRDNIGTIDKEMIRGSCKEGAMTTCTLLGGGSLIGPEIVGNNTKDDVELIMSKEIGTNTTRMGSKGAPLDYKVASFF